MSAHLTALVVLGLSITWAVATADNPPIAYGGAMFAAVAFLAGIHAGLHMRHRP